MVSDCSKSSQPIPRARSISAVVRPPIPPPTIIAFIARLHTAAKRNECLKSHEQSLRRKRLRTFRLQLGPGLRLSLNFEVLEILPVPHTVAEDLLLAGQILRRTKQG